MSVTLVQPKEVRAMVREGAKKRMSFAFCLDKSKDPLLMIQPGKKPETLRNPMKKEGGGPPMAWGTYVVRSGQMEMICESAPARMVTELKRFLKRNKPKVNVLFYDDGGNLLDSLKPEQPEEEARTAPPPPRAEPEPPARTAPVREPAPEAPAPDPAARAPEPPAPEPDSTGKSPARSSAKSPASEITAPLKRRLKALQPQMAQVPKPLERKLKRAAASAVRLISDERLEEAEAAVETLERTVARSAGSAARALGEGVKRAQTLRATAARAPEAARPRIEQALGKAARALKKRDLKTAGAVMDRVEKVLARIA